MDDPHVPHDFDGFEALCREYREMKHAVNNGLGVVMAMAELSQMNPANSPKLIHATLERGPRIVQLMTEFGNRLQELSDMEKRGELPRQ